MDRIKRSVLKNDKLDGVDIECFLKAIKIKQFVKADAKSEYLCIIQNHKDLNDEVSRVAQNSIFSIQKYLAKGINYDDIESMSVKIKLDCLT